VDNDPIASFEGEYRFLSNFWLCEIVYGGITFPSTEHAYQAAKTMDMDARRKIALAEHPAAAKKLGYKVKIRPDWDAVKDQIMLQLLLIKFADPILMARLRDTLPHELIEGNHWGDFYWGVCGGRGLNKLGKMLMRIRLNYTSVYLEEYNRLKRKLIPSLLDALSRLDDTTTAD
jgi:ribA/ribD-fused uncharacterized protein